MAFDVLPLRFGMWDNGGMGKTSAGGISTVFAILALSQRLGNYENKPLAIILAGATILFLLWFGLKFVKDGIAKLKEARQSGDKSKCRNAVAGFSGASILSLAIIASLIWGSSKTATTSSLSPPDNKSNRRNLSEVKVEAQVANLAKTQATRADLPRSHETVGPTPKTIINAPNGIGISGGTVTNPTVNNTTINQALPPRRIGDQDRSAMISALSKHPAKATVFAPVNDSEASRFAMDLHEILEKAGWDMQNEPVRYLISVGPMEEGVLLKVPGEPVGPGQLVTFSPDDPAMALGNRLQQLRITPKAQRYRDMKEGMIWVQVGPQPRN